jgi:hypothetical protein
VDAMTPVCNAGGTFVTPAGDAVVFRGDERRGSDVTDVDGARNAAAIRELFFSLHVQTCDVLRSC